MPDAEIWARDTFGATVCGWCKRPALEHPLRRAKKPLLGCHWTWFGVVVNALRGL